MGYQGYLGYQADLALVGCRYVPGNDSERREGDCVFNRAIRVTRVIKGYYIRLVHGQ